MTTPPTDLVSISQTDLNNFAASIETEVTAISTAVGVLGPYIQQLLANQATPLPPADETAINQAVTDLTTGVGNLDALEQPAPTPPPS
jgi:hypothetical protein